MSTQTAAKISYRKTSKGQWVAFGPASAIKAGATVTVTKASGEAKTELIESVGRPFAVNGRQMVYGYIGTAPIGTAPVVSASGCVAWPACRSGCETVGAHTAMQAEFAARLNAEARASRATAAALTGRCRTCRCHAEAGAGRPGTILFDGCDRCGCESA